jgi:hypothetical protein
MHDFRFMMHIRSVTARPNQAQFIQLQDQFFALFMAMSTAAHLLEAVHDRADCKALRLYIRKGYDVRVQIKQKRSLLQVVASFTCSDCDKGSMIAELIRRGAEVDARDDAGLTALMLCKTKTVATAPS